MTTSRLERFNQARIPARYINATLPSIVPDQARCPHLTRLYRWIAAFATREPLPREGILLSGPPGVGKTHAMAALLHHLTLGRAIAALFVDWNQLLQDIRSAFAGHGSVREHLEPLQSVQVLLLDDLRGANGSQWPRQLLDDVISARYNAALPTLLTTNLSLHDHGPHSTEGFASWTLQHTRSRLRQMCHRLTVTGPDRRAIRQ